MAYIVLADIVMAYIVVAYVIITYIVWPVARTQRDVFSETCTPMWGMDTWQ